MFASDFGEQFAIEKTVIWFFKLLDQRAYEGMWDLMAPDGCWNRSGHMLDSKASFMEAMAERPPHMVIRHLPINFGVGRIEGDLAEATFDLLLFRHIGEVLDGPAPLVGTKAITHWTTTLEKIQGSWKIKYLEFEVLMMRA